MILFPVDWGCLSKNVSKDLYLVVSLANLIYADFDFVYLHMSQRRIC